MSNSTPPTSSHEEKYGVKPSGGIKLPSIAFLSNQKEGFSPIGSQEVPRPSTEGHAQQPPHQPISRPMSAGVNPVDHHISASGTPPAMTIPKPTKLDNTTILSPTLTTPTIIITSAELVEAHMAIIITITTITTATRAAEEAEAENGPAANGPAANGAAEKKDEDVPQAVVAKKEKVIPYVLDKGPLEELLRDVFPKRRHIGSIIYNPTTTWETLQFENLQIDEHDKQHLRDIQQKYVERYGERYRSVDPEYIPTLPPLTEAAINCFVEIKIPYKFIKEFLENCNSEKVQRKRELWGGAGGIYTDDSDILAVLKHLGVFDNNADLSDTNPKWTKSEVIKPIVVHKDGDGVDLLDISVTLLILPTLKQYYGYYKNGMISSKSSSPQLSSSPSKLRTPPALSKTPSANPSRTSSNAASKKGSKKVSGFFKKIGSEWSGLLYRLRDISHDTHSEDEEVAELFEESGPLDIDRLSKVGRQLTDAEEQFLRDYKKYKDLNKVFEMHQLENPTAANSEQDIEDIDRLMFTDMNMVKLKDDLINQVPNPEYREILWEYRRSKWLSYGRVSEQAIAEKVNQRREEASIKHIPKELYPRIYTNLVDKGRTLKDDKRLNLEDLVEVVNEGWKKEERWTRAAEGLP
ncbi:uncharacterized protein CXQ87_001896 [Candidozyma duobushaemuli]|uniref:Gag1-like clamp domain-containing protein n=1 Tax=Candidozyma duobushaemuli TaxID=1231522 RepID=A0A2V1A716_9ASCO|nr:uncharacterized protein CXQ87_001896 [[Candida] duobushaemulonis]PVH13778.1 hypothetical protein CXQ87_001896 [[Candida] duobushaemulonis]